jgi:hypothetical protein
MPCAPFNLQTERLFILSVVVQAGERRQQWCEVPGNNAWLVAVNYQVWRPLLHVIQHLTGEFVYIVWGLWQEQQWKCHSCYVWQIRCGLCNSRLHETEHLTVPPSFTTPYVYLPILYSLFIFCSIWCTNLILLVLIPQITFVSGQRRFIFFFLVYSLVSLKGKARQCFTSLYEQYEEKLHFDDKPWFLFKILCFIFATFACFY